LLKHSARRWISLGLGAFLLSVPVITTSAFAASSTLEYGDQGAQVATLERDLAKLGDYSGNIDGIFGPEVFAGVEDFQRAHSLEVTGKAGPKTLELLYEAVAPKTSASTSLSSAPPAGYLYVGSKGAEVLTLQKDLAVLGFYSGRITGTYGPVTLKSVIAYQASVHLPDHGYVGALTDAALHKSLAARAQAVDVVASGSVSTTATSVIDLALKYQGAPYVWGGNSPATGFDCSGFVQWIFGQNGISLPRTTFEQWDVGTHVTMSQLQPGDLVFFTTLGVFCNHVGLYLGNGEFISDTEPGQGVLIQSLNTAYWADAFDGGVDVISGN
jgi:cell wall-associated NlpC family hydrolase